MDEKDPASSSDTPHVSVVMPCLNEADTLAICIGKARQALIAADIHGEIIVADNGSTDGSIEIAVSFGARVVSVAKRGYGSALMGGIGASRGRFIIMGDADDSYDFGEIPRFVEKLREGFDLVQGCRLSAGGGRTLPGAMPKLHRLLGNPIFSVLARAWFRAPVNDVYCGLRGFTRSLYDRLELQCTGMEFAIEMIVKASLHGGRITEVPITLHPDGRKAHAPHLRTFRDGWRTLRFFLTWSPRWLFLIPGLGLILLGLVGYTVALPATTAGRVTFDAHTLLVSSLFVILGYQSVQFAVFTKAFATSKGLLPPDARVSHLRALFSVEMAITLGTLATVAGCGLLFAALQQWRAVEFGPLDYAHTMRWVIPGVTLTALGFQTVLSGFFLNILSIGQRY